MNKMAVSRFVLSSLKNRSSQSLNSLKRSSGPSKKFHSSSYMRSETQKNSRLVPDSTQTSESSSRSYILPAAVAAGFASVAFLLHYNDERRAIPKGSGQGEKSEKNSIKGPKIGGPFRLYDTQGRVMTERDLMGKWVLLYFGYTSSPDVGPAEVQKMAKAINTLESTHNLKVLPVFVTIDPQRDTPSQLSAYLKEFDPRIVGLTGPAPAIRQMAQEYRVFFKKVEEDGDDYLVESSHSMYLMNPSLEISRCFGVEYNAEEMAEAILAEIKKSGA